eukprot:29116-Pelagococcus_subviridis.AAC.4
MNERREERKEKEKEKEEKPHGNGGTPTAIAPLSTFTYAPIARSARSSPARTPIISSSVMVTASRNPARSSTPTANGSDHESGNAPFVRDFLSAPPP